MSGMTMIASVSRVQCEMLCKMKIQSDRSGEHWWWTNFLNSLFTMAKLSGCWLVVTSVIKWLGDSVISCVTSALPGLSFVGRDHWRPLIGWQRHSVSSCRSRWQLSPAAPWLGSDPVRDDSQTNTLASYWSLDPICCLWLTGSQWLSRATPDLLITGGDKCVGHFPLRTLMTQMILT